MAEPEDIQQVIVHERLDLLSRIERNLDQPMALLGFVWLLLLVLELVRGLSPELARISIAIWVVFIFEFALRLLLAPNKLTYLRLNWLTALALTVPALRLLRAIQVVRAARAVSAVRGLRLLRLLSGINRSMRTLGRTLERRGFGYVLSLTLVVLFAGAAGMYAFERSPEGVGLDSFSTALWWTAMVLTTMGSEYWPVTAEGRLLCLILALYGFAMFGYVTATLASYFLARDTEPDASTQAPLATLQNEIAALRRQLRQEPPAGQ